MIKRTILGLSLTLLAMSSQAQSISYEIIDGKLIKKPSTDLNDSFVNSPLPKFSSVDLAGNRISSDSLKGKVVVLNLWFTKCAPCIKEMPELNMIKDDYKNQDVIFLSMAPEDNTIIKRFLKKYQFDFSILPDNLEYIESISKVMPVNMVIDKNGIVRKFMGGVPIRITSNEKGERVETLDSSEIRASIDSLLKE